MDNSKKIIDKIKKEQLNPLPKWRFRIRKYLIWGSYLFFIFIGTLSFSIILYTIQQSEFSLLKHMNHSILEFMLVLLPILWLLLLVVFLFGSILSAKNTDQGYKFTFSKWLAYSTALSIALGTLFFISGGAAWFENSFANQIEIYESINDKKIKIWSQPEAGNLSGEILEIQGDYITLRDFSGKEWKIAMNDSFIAPMVLLEKGEIVKLNGEISAVDEFKASHIRPWGNNNSNRGKNRNRKLRE